MQTWEPMWVMLVVAAPFVGSFVGVVVLRRPEGSLLVPLRSSCASCHQVLRPLDLVPVFSWLAALGRCRHCGTRLSGLYPAVELAALALALWAAQVFSGWLLLASCGLAWSLLAIAIIDQRRMLIDDALCLPLIPAGIVVAALLDHGLIIDHLLGAILGFAAFYCVSRLFVMITHREGLGLGDAKLLAAAGAWVGYAGLPSVIFVAAVAGLAAALLPLLWGGASPLGRRLPFGPPLALAAWLVWLYGPIGL